MNSSNSINTIDNNSVNTNDQNNDLNIFNVKNKVLLKNPIITTSVNVHGQKALNNIDDIDKIFFNIPIYSGFVNQDSKGSTILDLSKNSVKIIRQGDGKI